MGEERSAACALISDGSLPRGPCFSRLFTNTLSLGGRRITAHRSRQAKIVTQHRSLIFGTEQTARLQFRYHLIDKLVQPDRQMGRLNQKAVNRAVLEPSLHVVGDLGRGPLERSLPAGPTKPQVGVGAR